MRISEANINRCHSATKETFDSRFNREDICDWGLRVQKGREWGADKHGYIEDRYFLNAKLIKLIGESWRINRPLYIRPEKDWAFYPKIWTVEHLFPKFLLKPGCIQPFYDSVFVLSWKKQNISVLFFRYKLRRDYIKWFLKVCLKISENYA